MMVKPRRNPALTNLYNEIKKKWPKKDTESDGWVGDEQHQNTNSDHNPDPDGTVDAIDVDPDGINVEELLKAVLRHEATQYVIWQRRITSRSYSGGLGTWHPYTGKNPHTKHLHINTRTSHENSTKPWFTKEVTPVTTTTFTTEDRDKLNEIHHILTVLDGRNALGRSHTRLMDGTDHTDPQYYNPFNLREVMNAIDLLQSTVNRIPTMGTEANTPKEINR